MEVPSFFVILTADFPFLTSYFSLLPSHFSFKTFHRKGLQNALSEEGSPRFENINAIMQAKGLLFNRGKACQVCRSVKILVCVVIHYTLES